MNQDDREIIAWTLPNWRRRRNVRMQTGNEVSNEDGIFRYAFAALTFRHEEPAVHTVSERLPLKFVKIATPEQKEKFMVLTQEHERLHKALKEAERDIAANGLPVSWDWIQKHGKPRENIPKPFHSKAALANLRKGSKVVITTQSSEYGRIAGRVGKIVKKRGKTVIVRFGKREYRIPYSDLKPAGEVSAKERAKAKSGSEVAAKVLNQFNKVF